MLLPSEARYSPGQKRGSSRGIALHPPMLQNLSSKFELLSSYSQSKRKEKKKQQTAVHNDQMALSDKINVP